MSWCLSPSVVCSLADSFLTIYSNCILIDTCFSSNITPEIYAVYAILEKDQCHNATRLQMISEQTKLSTHRTKYQESADRNVEETCEIVPETRRLSRVSAVGLVTFTCCCGHSTPLSLHVSVRFQLKETNISASATLCQHVRKHMVTFRKHNSFYSFVDVIRPKRLRKYKVTFRKHAFLLFPLT